MTLKNETINIQLDHRTIREFRNEPVDERLLDSLFEVIQRTATSNGMQTYSVIRVTDPEIKRKISKVCNQEYVARAPELMIFIVDQYRNASIAGEKGVDSVSSKDMDRFFQGFTDASLAAQNMVVAAESVGLGTNYLGSILNDPEQICEILGMPQLTFPVVGVGLGYPNQEPGLKPRMNMNLRLFENSYKVFDSYLEELKEYDEIMQTYYDLRDANRRVDSFTDQVAAKTTKPVGKRPQILQAIRSQGFDLMVD